MNFTNIYNQIIPETKKGEYLKTDHENINK